MNMGGGGVSVLFRVIKKTSRATVSFFLFFNTRSSFSARSDGGTRGGVGGRGGGLLFSRPLYDVCTGPGIFLFSLSAQLYTTIEVGPGERGSALFMTPLLLRRLIFLFAVNPSSPSGNWVDGSGNTLSRIQGTLLSYQLTVKQLWYKIWVQFGSHKEE